MSEIGASLNSRAWRFQRHPVWLYRIVQVSLGWLVRLLFHTSRHGFDKIPKTGAVILASNHASYLDPVLMVACLKRPIFHIGKHTLFINRAANFILQTLAGQIPVDRETGGNDAAVEAGVKLLQQGYALGIYPEGTRTTDGQLQPGRTGVALFAFLTGAPVYPVAIDGTFRVWPRHQRFPHLFRRTRVIAGDPIQVPKNAASADNARCCRELTDEIMRALGQLLGQPYRGSKLQRGEPHV